MAGPVASAWSKKRSWADVAREDPVATMPSATRLLEVWPVSVPNVRCEAMALPWLPWKRAPE